MKANRVSNSQWLDYASTEKGAVMTSNLATNGYSAFEQRLDRADSKHAAMKKRKGDKTFDNFRSHR